MTDKPFKMPEPVASLAYGTPYFTADQVRAAYEQGLSDAADVCVQQADAFEAEPNVFAERGADACAVAILKLKDAAIDSTKGSTMGEMEGKQ